MHNFYGAPGGYGYAPPGQPGELLGAPMVNVPQYIPLLGQPREVEPTPEQQGFTTKLQLTIPDNFQVGVACMPDLMRHFTLNSLQRVVKDKNSADKTDPNVENWKGSGIGRSDTFEERDFKSRPANVDADCYFMLIENKRDGGTRLQLSNVGPRGYASDKQLHYARLKRLAKNEDFGSADDAARGRDGNAANGDSSQRVNKIHWDYEGAPSDDEELYPQVEADEPDEDPLNQPRLSLYGHKLRSLLQQQAEREVDDELEAYSDDEDGSQVSAPGKQQRSQDASESQSAKKAKIEAEKSNSIEERVTRFLLENNGKVQVKSILSHFNIIAKNDDFRLIQTIIQKRCTMSVEDKDNRKIKYIALKPEFMR
ncbi:hypothetical protein, conserved [Babesia ovata]|uniref:Transcription initiation factor IIF subunit alpha n=1 Tax=Babesia ovata TaxID=189622 RepID=A0A2H6KII6_9APIC|nr:uncharacterized protein BOVATA_042820 [Babesia ovata]GBE62789.1 hypothetical protein, conserved [Babesia ovata]